MPPSLANVALLTTEALIYFTVLAALFRARHVLGFGAFVAALGAFHFLETYLAAVLYVQFPGGIMFSPGSTILFAGKLAMLLLVYIREDASAVRQPVYGLFIANFVMVALVAILRQHEALTPIAERQPDFAFMNEMGGLMLWGTILLFLDAIGIILLYEKSAAWLGNRVWARLWLSLSVMLTLDQIGFYLALHYLVGAPVDVLVGGWVGKMFAALLYSLLTTAYLRWFEYAAVPLRHARLLDLFEILTYRERYEALLKTSGRDGLTGAYDRGRLDEEGPQQIHAAVRSGKPVSVIVVDVDRFKSINDQLGHSIGDGVLKQIARLLSETMGEDDRIYRYGGDEFVVISTALTHPLALLAAERMRLAVTKETTAAGVPVTVSVGVATSPDDGADFGALFKLADRALYAAKASGRDRVVGRAGREEAFGAAAEAAVPAAGGS